MGESDGKTRKLYTPLVEKGGKANDRMGETESKMTKIKCNMGKTGNKMGETYGMTESKSETTEKWQDD